MMRIHCDGCDNVIGNGEGFFTVNVRYSTEIKDSTDHKTEATRTLCLLCMVKVRPGLDAVDGKTD